MLEDYREVLIRNHYLNDFLWTEVKEKYGTLRLYSGAAPDEVLELESKYDYISRFFCISCGRMNAPVLTGGWIEPLCKDCYNKRIASDKRWYDTPVDYDMELLVKWKNYDGSNELIKLNAISFNISMWDYRVHDLDPEKIKVRVNDLKSAVDHGDFRVECNLGYHTKSTDHRGTSIQEIQDIPILKACGIADLVDSVSVFCAIEEHFSMEKTASETTEAKGTTNEDKVIMHGFDVKTSFRKMK